MNVPCASTPAGPLHSATAAHVHVQPRALVKPPQRRRGVEPAQPAVAGQTTNHGAVFCSTQA
jgi:hypothetical protein